MSLESGSKLGPYEIIAPVGAGGMGEVYKAKDTRLDRTVAIKVLPSHLADNARLRDRFEREARAVSSLNHPHICTLYDIGSQDGVDFLVLEYLEGETLADRLKRGALPLDQALRTGIEVADALDKAHRQGVVHRDLKPGNIMLTKSGAKLLDFGLAKLAGAEGGSVESALPTQQKSLTAEGSILGTLQYMAPEQLEGKEADARTDLFAFGAVVYEMLTGKRAFEGKSQASLIAAIMEHDPAPMSELQPMTPPVLDRVIKKCLAKEPDRRWQSAGDLHDELKWIAEGGRAASQVESSGVRRSIPGGLALVLVGLLLGAILAGVAVWGLTRPAPLPVTRFAIHLPPSDKFERDLGGLAISPDGQNLVYAARRGSGTTQLYVRPMQRLDAMPIRGTEGALGPFFSPDGQWIGFLSDGKLKKVSLTGGPALTLCDEPSSFGGASWGPDDTIFFFSGPEEEPELSRVSASGGTPEPVVTLEPGEEGQGPLWPEILPGGKAVLYTAWRGGPDNASIAVQSLETGERRTLVEGGTYARYVPTGHIVFARGALLAGSLLAAPFDLERLEITGSPVPVLENLAMYFGATAQFGLSRDGTLVYVSGTVSSDKLLVWVDRQGVERPLTETLRAYRDPRLSPDGRRLAVTILDPKGEDVWVLELGRGTLTRLTLGEGRSTRPLWSPDGERVLFASDRVEDDFNIFSQPADGSGAAEQLTAWGSVPTSVSSDGKTIVFRQNSGTTGRDIGMVRVEGERQPEMLLQTPFDEHTGMLSPEDRWLAYVSNESGREEIYLTPFPGPGGKRQISTEGGTEPLWSRDGRELFYRSGEKTMAVAISTEPELTAGKPTLLFEGLYETGMGLGPNPGSNYDVAPDGRFVVIRDQGSGLAQINVVLNWFEELKRLVPTDN